MTLTHFKNKNQTIEMVDISKKKKTARIAAAESLIKIDKSLYQVLLNDQNLFSNLCATAKIAGVLAAKKYFSSNSSNPSSTYRSYYY